jgi:hypothetical protein
MYSPHIGAATAAGGAGVGVLATSGADVLLSGVLLSAALLLGFVLLYLGHRVVSPAARAGQGRSDQDA